MKTIFDLFKQDIKKIIHSKPVWITILAFCLVPATYAVLNIKASWDPYSTANIRRLPIAVVNSDEGSTIKGKNLNVGKQITNKLKTNHDVKWVITNDWDGNNGLNQGKYYALIEIPSDFSSRLATLTTDSPQKPTIVYKSNEKLNPAATKITGQAKTTLTDQIRTNFTQLSGKLVLKQLNNVGADISSSKPQILGIKTTLLDSINEIKKTSKQLNQVNGNASHVKQYLNAVKNDIPKVSSQINNLSDILTQQQKLLTTTKNSISSTKNELGNALNSIQGQTDSFQSAISGVGAAGNSINLIRPQVTTAVNASNSLVNVLNDGLRVLDVVNSIIPTNRGNNLIGKFASAKKQIKAQQGYLKQLKQSNSQGEVKRLQAKINRLNDQLDRTLSSAAADSNTVEDGLDSISNSTNEDTDNNSDVINSLKSVIPELQAIQKAGDSVSDLTISRVNTMQAKLAQIKTKLSDLDNQLNFLTDENLDKVINLLGKNPDVANFLASPVKLQTKELYNMGLFGYGATPFYTVLSIWIGILLLTTIIAWKYPEQKRAQRKDTLHPYHSYGGKFLLYLSIAFTQTFITWFGEIVLLGIRPRSLFAFIGIDLFTALVFTMIIFSLVFSFGNAGKVIAVLLMILQIFGTGGLYPLEVIPKGLTAFTPFLPFTYAIGAFREAIAGPIWSVYFSDMLTLGLFGVIMVLLTPIFRRLLKKPVTALEEGFEESQL
ncbi:YhgE/Pip domain-containing protein [Lentilactobacillus sp. Marseille-Q4993]|uniref:YhgE/Pip domain-containing protein n=1 Tax=Lentilactobacillus sp. Marseille-Q4993 TaxID=3039492 RepID=UPI0024BC5BA3|nr:YhgE/Pip domain-containing protein [Lentilactobacillus sp. Marseille-Q4993]